MGCWSSLWGSSPLIPGAQAAFPLSVDSCLCRVPAEVPKGFLSIFQERTWELWLQLNRQVPLHVQCTGVKPIPNVTDSYGERFHKTQRNSPLESAEKGRKMENGTCE